MSQETSKAAWKYAKPLLLKDLIEGPSIGTVDAGLRWTALLEEVAHPAG